MTCLAAATFHPRVLSPAISHQTRVSQLMNWYVLRFIPLGLMGANILKMSGTIAHISVSLFDLAA
jgi:hypothetical protein